MPVKLLFFAGSKRDASLNKRLAKAASIKAGEFDAEVTFIDLKDFEMPIYCGDLEKDKGIPEAALRLAELVKAHDGVFIASPEYNSSISPLLKNTLDWVSRIRSDETPPRTPWQEAKTFAIGGTSMGLMGGLRGIQLLSALLINGYQVNVIPQTVAVGKGHEVLGEDGSLSNPQSEAMLSGAMKAFVETATNLKSA
ncbi:NADPH-dependent FMN reductase [Hyphomicrobiales bacterium 4NK60-0047b]